MSLQFPDQVGPQLRLQGDEDPRFSAEEGGQPPGIVHRKGPAGDPSRVGIPPGHPLLEEFQTCGGPGGDVDPMPLAPETTHQGIRQHQLPHAHGMEPNPTFLEVLREPGLQPQAPSGGQSPPDGRRHSPGQTDGDEIASIQDVHVSSLPYPGREGIM